MTAIERTMAMSPERRTRWVFVAAFFLALAFIFSAATRDATAAEPGVYPDRIVFGQSAALDGPAGALGRGMRAGLLAAFREANAAGGVNHRSLQLMSKDDGYEPDLAARNTRQLIEIERVFALIGEVGTPTSAAALPIAAKNQVPFIAPFTGAGFLRNRDRFPNVVNLRASYAEETEAWIAYLTGRGIDRIAVLFQDDSFGRSGLQGVRTALHNRGLRIIARGSYARNLTAIHSALFTIRKAEPQAIAIVGAYRPAAEFIKLARSLGMNPVFVNISFVGAKALAEQLGEDGRGVIVSQVVPFPEDRSLTVVDDYHKAMTAHVPDDVIGFVSLEGYLAGRLAVAALRRIEGDPTREKLLHAFFETGPFDLGGLTVTFGKGSNQGLDRVYMTAIGENKTLQPLDMPPTPSN